MKTIAVIPARGGSKRLPRKNVRKLGALPLLAHSIQYAKKHSFVDEVFVSTDDSDIKAVAEQFGAKVIDRPVELSGDHEPTVSALVHVLENVANTVENVILLQATNPLRPEFLLKECFDVYNAANADSVFTVTRSHHKLGRISDNRFHPFNYVPGQRSQDLEPLFFENGLVYISRVNLIRQNLIISPEAVPHLVDHIYAGVDIDSEDDFLHAEYLYHKYYILNNESIY